jgi:hypothetical protein
MSKGELHQRKSCDNEDVKHQQKRKDAAEWYSAQQDCRGVGWDWGTMDITGQS